MTLKGKLSLVMPAYNEGQRIYKNALEASETISHFADDDYEVIIINDGSQDNTFAEAQKASAHDSHIISIDQQPNVGKGQALRLGTAHASGDYIAFCDADLDLHPSQLQRFIEILYAEDADAVIGSKLHPESELDYPLSRRIISRGYYLLLLFLFRLKIRDTQTGLKLFKADIIKPVMSQILVKRFAYDIEVLAILNSRGYKLTQAPVKLVFQRGTGGSRIGMRDVWYMTLDTVAIFYRLKMLHYYDKDIAKQQPATLDGKALEAIDKKSEIRSY